MMHARTHLPYVPGEDVSPIVPLALLVVGAMFVATAARSVTPSADIQPVAAPAPQPAAPPPAPPTAREEAPAVAAVAPSTACGKLVVRFGVGAVNGPSAATAPLVKLAESVRNDERAVVVVEGHADAVGDEIRNLRLSRERASWVAARLQQAGVPRARITVRGLGAFSPVSGASETESANRRVVVSVEGASGCAPVPGEEIQ